MLAAVAHGFAPQAERALSPAPLRGYVVVDERELTLRGRVRIAETRLIPGAAELLLRMPQIPKPVRLRLLRVRATLEEVEPARPSPSVRAPKITRLNARSKRCSRPASPAPSEQLVAWTLRCSRGWPIVKTDPQPAMLSRDLEIIQAEFGRLVA